MLQLYEDSENAGKSESQKHNTFKECATTDILPEPTEEKTHQSFEEDKEEEMLKTEVWKLMFISQMYFLFIFNKKNHYSLYRYV